MHSSTWIMRTIQYSLMWHISLNIYWRRGSGRVNKKPFGLNSDLMHCTGKHVAPMSATNREFVLYAYTKLKIMKSKLKKWSYMMIFFGAFLKLLYTFILLFPSYEPWLKFQCCTFLEKSRKPSYGYKFAILDLCHRINYSAAIEIRVAVWVIFLPSRLCFIPWISTLS